MPLSTPPRARPLLAAGALAGPFFIAVYTIEDLTRPGFSPLRDQVSQLALGPWGWVQAVNFFVTGLLTLVLAAGLRRALRPHRLVPSAVAVAGLGLIAATFFTTNPGNGYPPGARAVMTVHGQIHDLAAGLFFIGLSVAGIACGRRASAVGHRGFAVYSIASVVAVIGFLSLSSAGYARAPGLSGAGGLLERFSLVSGFVWLTALAVYLARGGRLYPAQKESRAEPETMPVPRA